MTSRSAKRRANKSTSVYGSRKRSLIAGGLLLAAAVGLAGWWFLRSNHAKQATTNSIATSTAGAAARQLSYEVVNSYPHDPDAYLQGLVWYDNGFYESTGLHGRSTLRRVEFPSGRILKSISLDADLFGEGLALVGDRLVQLTWQAHRGFVYERESFKLIREFTYNSEGWGLAFDGKNLILSDGSNTLTYLDAETYQPVRRLQVTMNGRPVTELNELEFIDGEIWSNVWQTDLIVIIDPSTGQVKSFLNLKGILASSARSGSDAVLNGIAYDSDRKRIFVGGKLWPRLFEIKIKS